MFAEIKEKWLAAINGGGYTQGKGFLLKNRCYCIGGVLCDLYMRQHRRKWKLDIGTSGRKSLPFPEGGENRAWRWIPEPICAWAGLDPKDAKLKQLYELNDKQDCSFSQLADFIKLNF